MISVQKMCPKSSFFIVPSHSIALYYLLWFWIPNYFSRCSIWLAVDVWMCTASILHLVVISLDRYIAVTQPMKYPNLMTSKKAKLLITGAWILSFVICFPPLVGWTDNKDEDDGTNSDLNNTQSKPRLMRIPLMQNSTRPGLL